MSDKPVLVQPVAADEALQKEYINKNHTVIVHPCSSISKGWVRLIW